MTALRVAFLGLRHYHANFWARAVKDHDGATVAGVWDADAGAAAAFAAEHGVTHVADRAALLSGCDAVAVCSTTDEHGPLVRAAAAAAKPVLCEKPLAISVDEGLAIARAVAAAGTPFMQSFPKRLDPVTLAVRDIVAKGELGRITMVRVRHGHSHGLDPAFHDQWFTDPDRSGGGTLLDEGIHAADFLRFVFGEPLTVTATISATLGLRVEDTALAAFAYPDGMLAEVATSWCFAAADTSIEVYGTAGTLLVSGVDIASRPARESGFLRVFRSGEGEGHGWTESDIVPHFKTGVFHEHVAWTFVDALIAKTPFPSGLAEGLRAHAMIEAAYAAARTGKAQTIAYPEVPAA